MRYRRSVMTSDIEAERARSAPDIVPCAAEDRLWADIFETAWSDTVRVQLRNTLLQDD